jgi:hypothetical protein
MIHKTYAMLSLDGHIGRSPRCTAVSIKPFPLSAWHSHTVHDATGDETCSNQGLMQIDATAALQINHIHHEKSTSLIHGSSYRPSWRPHAFPFPIQEHDTPILRKPCPNSRYSFWTDHLVEQYPQPIIRHVFVPSSYTRAFIQHHPDHQPTLLV